MKRLELYKQLLNIILENYSGLDPDSENYEDCGDLLDDDNIAGTSEMIKDQPNLEQNIRPILNI